MNESARRVLRGFGADVRHALRRLLAAPAFTLFAATSLAAGLAVTTAAYSIVASLAFKSSGIADDSRVATILTAANGRLSGGGISRPDFEDLRAAQRSFVSMTASARFFSSVTLPSVTELISSESVDGVYFATLGVQPTLGRAVDATDVARSSPVVVIGDALWTQRFRCDPTVIGSQIRIGGRPFEVIGVAPRGFDGLGRPLDGTRLWVPLSAEPPRVRADLPERDRALLTVVGRLAPEATMSTASAEAAAIAARLDTAYPRSAARGGPPARAWVARPVASSRPGDEIVFRFGVAFVALVALVLVVACTNLSNLVLARGTERAHELAVRRALGASRWRLVREQLAESVIVALLGTGGAWFLFRALGVLMDVELPIANRLFVSFAPTLDWGAALAAAAALLLSLFVFGLEPALKLARYGDVRGVLSTGGSIVVSAGGNRHRTLVRCQVAIAAGFFIIATMCVKAAVSEARHDSGVDLDRIAVATMNFWSQQWDRGRSTAALTRVLDDVRKDPSIEAAAVATGVPFGSSATPALRFSPADTPIDADSPSGLGIAASGGFFRTMGISILRGRAFDDRDGAGALPVVVVSERTALQLFGTGDVVGRQIRLQDRNPGPSKTRSVASKLGIPGSSSGVIGADGRTSTIVGVAEDTDVVHLFSRDGDVLYVPLAQQSAELPFAVAIVRTVSAPAVGVRILREAIRRVDPDLAVESAGTGTAALGGPTVFLRAAAIFAVSLGALTLLLAMVGLYGVQSHGVTRRTREIGVRMSFGASAAQIRRMVLQDGCRPVLEGLALGLFIGFVGRALMRAFLWEQIEVVDRWMVLAVPVPLVLAAFCACYWPARRASRVEPMVALRRL